MDGLGRVGFEVAAEADDEVVDGAGVGVFFYVPDVFEKLGARNDLAGVIEEIAQEVGLHEGEVNGFVLGMLGADFEVVEINDATSEGVGGRGFGGGMGSGGSLGGEGVLPVHAAQEGGEASEKDAEVKGFGEVVVGTGGEAFDDVFSATAGGEQEDGGVAAGCAEGADDGEAVAAGKHDVEEDGGRRVGCAGGGGVEEPGEGGVAVGLVMGAIAFGFEVEDEALGEVFFVFDDGDERGRGLGHGVGVVLGECMRGCYLRRRVGTSALRPFQAIWIPIQKRMKATTRRMP